LERQVSLTKNLSLLNKAGTEVFGERASAQIPKHPELMTTSRKIFLDVSTFEEKALFDFSHN
jgi:hypothetical protein